MAERNPGWSAIADLRLQELKASAHDLRNLVSRLTFLAETLQRDMPPSPARDGARDLLEDTTRRLGGIADRLRRLSAPES